MNFTLYNVLASAITSIGIVGGFILLSNLVIRKKASKKANFFLILLVCIMTIRMMGNFVIYAGFHSVFPHLIFAAFPYRALIGPFFFLYVYYLLYPNRPFKWYDLLHLSLFIYIYYSTHWAFTILPKAEKINAFNFFSHPKHVMSSWGFWITLIILIIQLTYIAISFWMLKQKRKLLLQTSANTSIEYLDRFKQLVVGYGGYVFVTILGVIGIYWMKIQPMKVEFFLFLPNSLLLIVLAVLNLKQPDRLLFILQTATPQPTKPTKSIDIIKPIAQQLQQVMETDQPYLNPELRIHDLAKLVDIPVRKLSDQINKELGTNFYDFINQYRVDAFKKLALQPNYANFTLLAIAQEVGFNSKASFNRIFKKQTGLTPSQFIQKQKVSSTVIEPCTP
ncbi:MAG: helix-turn-helix domain-containing protein [Saprospiraceae bacterium]